MNYDLYLAVKSEGDAPKNQEKLTSMLEKEGFGVAEFMDWGKKPLAYPIQKQLQAQYYIISLTSEHGKPAALHARFKLDETILRALVLKKSKMSSKPKSNEVV